MKKLLPIVIFYFLLLFLWPKAALAVTFPKDTNNSLNSGLVSFWKFDETSVSTVADSADGVTGTATGTTIIAPGVEGSARSFNGSSYIDFGTRSILSSSNLSISLWVKGNPSGYAIGSSYNGGSHPVDSLLYISSTSLLFWLHDEDGNKNSRLQTTSVTIPMTSANTWYHVVVTRSGVTSGAFYINGIQQPTTQWCNNGCGSLWGNLPTEVGRSTAWNNYFFGILDEIGVWNRVLNSQEISDLSFPLACINGPTTKTVTGSIANSPTGGGACADTTANCVNTNNNTYSLNVSTYANHSIFAKNVSGYVASPGPTTVSVACSNVTGPAFTYYALTCAPASNIVGMWHMDEASGSAVADWSGNNNNGTAVGKSGFATTSLNSNLISYYKLDEATAGTAIDASDANFLDPAGSTTVTTGKIGGARNFNGSSATYLTCSDASCGGSARFDPSSSAGFSYSTWVYPTSYPNGNYHFLFHKTQDNAFWGAHINASGQVRAEMVNSVCNNDSGFGWRPEAVVPLNVWSMVTVTQGTGNPTVLKIYINGSLKYTSPQAGYYCDLSGPLSLGSQWAGKIDEAGVWKRTLSDAEVASLYNSGSGQTLSPATGPTVVVGKYSNARSFNGAADYVDVANSATLNLSGSAITLSAWIYPTATLADCNGIISKSSATNLAYSLYSAGGACGGSANAIKFFANWPNAQVISQATVPLNAWTHVVGVYDGASAKIYLNGNLDKTTGASGNVGKNNLSLSIGRLYSDSTSYYFPGVIDEVKVFSRALSWGEVASEFSQQCCTGVKFFCGNWSSCQGPCGSATQTKTCYDSGCVKPLTESQACTPLAAINIADGVSNAPVAVSVCARKKAGGGAWCSDRVCSPLSPTGYSLTVNNQCTYVLSIDNITGRTVEPQDYELAVGCQDVTGPRFWYDSDAGIVSARGTINAGAGQISQSGTSPGYRLENHVDATPTGPVSYTQLLKTVLNNGGFSNAARLESQAACQPGTVVSTPNYDFYCYSTSQFDTVFNTAVTNGSSTKTLVLTPRSDTGAGGQIVTTPKTITNRKMVVFTNGTLEVRSNVAVAQNDTSAVVFVVNNPQNPQSFGDLLVSSAVVNLDGVYLFPGKFDSVYGGGDISKQLLGQGALLGHGSTNWNLGRVYPAGSGAAEKFEFEPKYLMIYKNVLALSKYQWSELPPE